MAPGRKADVSARSNDAVGLGRGKCAQGAIRPSLTTAEVKAPSMDNFSLCPGLDDKERERSSSATDEAVKAKKSPLCASARVAITCVCWRRAGGIAYYSAWATSTPFGRTAVPEHIFMAPMTEAEYKFLPTRQPTLGEQAEADRASMIASTTILFH